MGFDETLDISDLLKCADNFFMTLQKASAIEHGNDSNFSYDFARSAMIHVFGITIEQSWKMMQRWIKMNADNKIHEKPKRELFRTAHQSGLISNPKEWWGFYEGRNKTSHAYHEAIAEDIYALAKKFDWYLKDFIERLEARV